MLLLGLLVAAAQGGEVQWRPTAAGLPAPPESPASPAAPAAGVGLGCPVPLAETSLAPAASPVVSLGRPVAAAGAGAWTALRDTQIQPASYSTGVTGSPRFTARAKAEDSAFTTLGAPIKGPPLIETPNDNGPQVALTETRPPLDKILIMGPEPAPGGPEFAPDGCCDGGACCGNGCCGNPCGGGDGGPGMRSRAFWVRGEYLLWAIKDSHSPPLVTSGSITDEHPGAIGQPGTQVLFGDRIEHGAFSGGRLEIGGWFDDDQRLGLEGGGFLIGPRTDGFTAGSNGDRVLARPALFIDPASSPPGTGVQRAEVISGPPHGEVALTSGNVIATDRSRLFGGDLNLLTNLDRYSWYRLDLLGGVRYLQLDESLDVTKNPLTEGVLFNETDHFGTRDTFYGGQIGLKGEFYWRRWQLELRNQIAFGDTHQAVDIRGTGVATADGMVIASGGGQLAEPSNMGHFSRDRFAVVPEFGINLGYQLTDHLRATVGYTFLYWSSVARPGDQIDPAVNATQNPIFGGSGLVGPARPAFSFHETDFWAQGANVGLEWRW